MLELEDDQYALFQTLVTEVLPQTEQENDQNFDVSSLRKFIKFHEFIDMSKKLLKPNLGRFFIKRIDALFDALVEKSAEEAERFEEEAVVPGEVKKFVRLMPYVEIYVDTLVKNMAKKIEEQRLQVSKEPICTSIIGLSVNKPQIVFNQDQKPFHVLLTNSILRDANYLFVRKLGSKILDFVLDFRNNISRIEEIAEYVKRLKMNEELSQWLLDQIKQRLLSPGVTTLNILSTYFHIVETLTIIIR